MDLKRTQVFWFQSPGGTAWPQRTIRPSFFLSSRKNHQQATDFPSSSLRYHIHSLTRSIHSFNSRTQATQLFKPHKVVKTQYLAVILAAASLAAAVPGWPYGGEKPDCYTTETCAPYYQTTTKTIPYTDVKTKTITDYQPYTTTVTVPATYTTTKTVTDTKEVPYTTWSYSTTCITTKVPVTTYSKLTTTFLSTCPYTTETAKTIVTSKPHVTTECETLATSSTSVCTVTTTKCAPTTSCKSKDAYKPTPHGYGQ
ncbi:hypothetical protein CLAFUR4_14434 [Fulvia fulva]|nr:hypothetical protein CLAFUR4_14434 [Fulvia fulva]WPV37693.1 hypothetical protein CLAFUW7_14443 [Fulvia fulva]